MAAIDEARLLGRMMDGVTYWQADILYLFKSADEDQRAECLESLGSLVSSGRVQRTYRNGLFSYIKSPQFVIDRIDAKDAEPKEQQTWDRRIYAGYGNDLGSHRELAMIARGGR